MKNIIINQDKCIGCNTCCLLDPDTFELDPTNYKAKVKKQPEVISEKTESAVNSCPVEAITIVDKE